MFKSILTVLGWVVSLIIIASFVSIGMQYHQISVIREKIYQNFSLVTAAKAAVTDNASKGQAFATGWIAPPANETVASVAINPANGEITIAFTEEIAPAGSNTLIFAPRVGGGGTGNPLTPGISVTKESIIWSCNSAASAASKGNYGSSGTIASDYITGDCREHFR